MPAFSTMMGASALALAFASVASAGFTLTDEYTKDNFFNEFDFFTEDDPTHGTVKYVEAQVANDNSYAGYYNEGFLLGLDHKTVNPPSGGRDSTRLVSKKSWTHGLFIADIQHMPGNACGIWPAYWLVGPDWPAGGEIDIIEGVNTQTTTSVTLHTAEGCSINNDGAAEGTTLVHANCNENTAYTGCGQTTSDNQNYGDGLNAIQGGVYATQWTSDFIAVWFFPRTAIPEDINSGTPNPDGWGKPIAKFNGADTCNIDQFFHDHRIVINTTFCGDWAGSVWQQNDECMALAPTCEEYVLGNPDVFGQAFWLFNSIRVYAQE
jgi:hypothetical protein